MITGSVHLVVSPHSFQQDGFGAFVLNEAEQDSKIVAHAAGPGTLKPALELMGPQSRVESILGEELQRCSDVFACGRISLDESLCGPHKRGRAQQETLHDKIFLRRSSGLVGSHCPASSSLRAWRISEAISSRRRSVTRWRSTSTRSSCSSRDNWAAASRTSPNCTDPLS